MWQFVFHCARRKNLHLKIYGNKKRKNCERNLTKKKGGGGEGLGKKKINPSLLPKIFPKIFIFKGGF